MWSRVTVIGLPTVVHVVWWWSVLVAVTARSQKLGPAVQMTRGEVWPKPAIQLNCDERLAVEPENFHFDVRTAKRKRPSRCAAKVRKLAKVIRATCPQSSEDTITSSGVLEGVHRVPSSLFMGFSQGRNDVGGVIPSSPPHGSILGKSRNYN